MPRPLLRQIALLALFIYGGLLSVQCASFGAGDSSQYEQLEAVGAEIPPPPADFVPVRVVLLEFKNAAGLGRFDVIPDGDYSTAIIHGEATATDETGTATESDATPAPEPDRVDTGAVAREVTETALFQTGRFEIIPGFRFRDAMQKAQQATPGLDNAGAIAQAAESLDVQYVLYGTLTDFEIRQQRDYWQLPLWAILLVASFFIQDDDLRVFVWYTMLRIALVVPLNSEFWDYGIQWDNLDLNVDVGMDLRMVDARTGSVAYADSAAATRVENVRNLNLMVWATNRRIKITQSNAGRQIRFVARDLIADLARYVDATAVPPASKNVAPTN